MQFLKQSTAVSVLVGPVLDANGDPYTGAVIGDFNLTVEGVTAAMLSPSTATHSHNGHYLIGLTAVNVGTVGRLAISMNKAGYGMTVFRYMVLTGSEYDAFVTNGTVRPASIADAVFDEPYADHDAAGTFGKIFNSFRKGNPAINGTVVAGTLTTTQFSSSVTAYSADAFVGSVLLFVDGSSLAEFSSPIVDYDPANGLITIERTLPSAPIAGDEFVIQPANYVHSIASIVAGVWSALTSGFSVAGSTGEVVKAFASMLEYVSGLWRWKESSLTMAPGGAGSISVLPAAATAPERGDLTKLVAFVGETITTSLTVYQPDGETPWNLGGKTLAVVFEDPKTGDDIATIESGSITIGGTQNSVVSFAYPSAVTQSQRELAWSLRDAAAPKTVYLRGVVEVRYAAGKE